MISADLIKYLYPDATWSMGEDYASLEWYSDNVKKPTEEELTAAMPDYEAYLASRAYLGGRKREMPSLDELNIALWERIVENRPEASDALQIKRMEVKNKYPKP